MKNKYLSGFGKRLKVAIKKKFKFQKDFAHTLGVTESTLSSWIKGKSFPENLIILTNISKILDISLDWLILGKLPLKLDSTLLNKVIQITNINIPNRKKPIIDPLLFTNIYKYVYKEYVYNMNKI